MHEDETLKPLGEKSHLKKENVFSVRIRDLNTSALFVELKPPFFKNISLVKFSPSGRYLLVSNENCQYFYIYELLPSTNKRFDRCPNMCLQEKIRLQYSLFRGYTAAVVTDVQFLKNSNVYSDKEQLLVINSSNGTSHVFNLRKNYTMNEIPIQKVAGEESMNA